MRAGPRAAMHAFIMRTCLASILSASFLSLSAVAAHAQAPGAAIAAASDDDAGPQNTLTTNPLWDLLAVPNLAYERAIGRHSSIMVAGLYLAGHATNSSGQTSSASLGELTVQPHFYFGQRALEGAYIAPFVELVDVSVDDSSGSSASGAGLAVGATVGYSWLVGPANIKVGIGAELASASAHGVSQDGSTSTVTASGAGLAMDLTAGFAF